VVFAGLYTITNADSGRRLYAQKDKNGANGVGAWAGTLYDDIYDDQMWNITYIDGGLYTIMNAASGRRLFAKVDKNGESGFGAQTWPALYDDQKWNITDIGGGSYTITNAASGRLVFAQRNTNCEDGTGAGIYPYGVYDDMKWHIEKATLSPTVPAPTDLCTQATSPSPTPVPHISLVYMAEHGRCDDTEAPNLLAQCGPTLNHCREACAVNTNCKFVVWDEEREAAGEAKPGITLQSCTVMKHCGKRTYQRGPPDTADTTAVFSAELTAEDQGCDVSARLTTCGCTAWPATLDGCQLLCSAMPACQYIGWIPDNSPLDPIGALYSSCDLISFPMGASIGWQVYDVTSTP